jgi:hypothetical protein
LGKDRYEKPIFLHIGNGVVARGDLVSVFRYCAVLPFAVGDRLRSLATWRTVLKRIAMKNTDPVTLEYWELCRYQDITEAAILLVGAWEKADRSAHDWIALSEAVERLAKALVEEE